MPVPSLVQHRGVVEQLDHAPEVGLLADRELERRDPGAERGLELVERAIERRPLTVELVDEDRPRHAELLRHAPRGQGLDLDALDRRDDEHREVDDP